ncbi:MAG: DUF3142 domain-containing protein [Rheinheimera sp.]|nr:DUF3142 domain-containing protein [Rheinheimera sp.]
MQLAWRRCSLWLLACLIAGCTPPVAVPPSKTFAQHVYIWQRIWRPAHAAVLQQSHQDFSQLRVLSLQFHLSAAGPVWTRAAPDWVLLAQDQRAVTLVLRLDGQLSQLPNAAMVWQQLQSQLSAAQQAGVKLQAIEIDYDAARAALAPYRQWLQALRKQLPASLSLQITALPDWLKSEDYPSLCQVADQLTLQLHSVLSPAHGLFDLERAKTWTQSAATTTPCPLFLALPAYHSALISTPAGDKVESETPLRIAGERQALLSRPEAVADFLTWLHRQSLPQITGLVWFRLPLPDDQRSWPLPTLQALVHGKALFASLQTELIPHQGRFDIKLRNNGNLECGPAGQTQLSRFTMFRGRRTAWLPVAATRR